MSTIFFQHSLDSLGSEHGWLPFCLDAAMGLGAELFEELHYMEQFFIKLQNIYAFVCQVAQKMGNSGACRREQLAQVTVDDIRHIKSALIVNIREFKTKISSVQ
ncbi:hypothetical protein NQ317_003335 [Molorchus minor]|uniref:Uncharacterized protein n=1 Tax=Molorchus minor TaxID=1323400 RepID=A0ABQ9J163_9CUCU|nr:hypothetical protein NQ317_003335 [Molorchus minor]